MRNLAQKEESSFQKCTFQIRKTLFHVFVLFIFDKINYCHHCQLNTAHWVSKCSSWPRFKSQLNTFAFSSRLFVIVRKKRVEQGRQRMLSNLLECRQQFAATIIHDRRRQVQASHLFSCIYLHVANTCSSMASCSYGDGKSRKTCNVTTTSSNQLNFTVARNTTCSHQLNYTVARGTNVTSSTTLMHIGAHWGTLHNATFPSTCKRAYRGTWHKATFFIPALVYVAQDRPERSLKKELKIMRWHIRLLDFYLKVKP